MGIAVVISRVYPSYNSSYKIQKRDLESQNVI